MANAQSRFGNPANYNATPSIRTDGDYSALEVDAVGNVRTTEIGGAPVNIAASGLVLSGPGEIVGFFVNSTSGGSIRFSDALTATTPYSGAATIAPAVGYYAYPCVFRTGCYATIATAALDVTIFTKWGINQPALGSMSPSISSSISTSVSTSVSPSSSTSASPSISLSISPSGSLSSSISSSTSPSGSVSSSISPSKSSSISPSTSTSASSSLSSSISPSGSLSASVSSSKSSSKSPSSSTSASSSISPSTSISVSPSPFE